MTNAEIAAAYLAYAKDQGEANQWAADSVMDLTYEDRWDDLWDIILAMSRDPADVDVGALAFVAAGPVEDLICKAGPAYIDRILHEAKSNARLGRLLTGVWLRRADPAVRERLVAFCRAFPDPIDGEYVET